MRVRMAGAAVAALALVAAAGAAATPKWNLMPAIALPDGADSSQMQGVSVVSPQDVWTAGAWWDENTVHPMIRHWNGSAWSAATLPTLPQNTYLGGVDAVDGSNVWAVGSTDGGGTPSLLHYDGSSWTTVPTPDLPAGTDNDLDGLDMRTAGDGWAVGETSSGTLNQPLILRRQGGKWITSPVPKGAVIAGRLVSVAAAASDDVWAVGADESQGPESRLTTGLVMHFDGNTWSTVKVPTTLGTRFNAVAVAGPGDVWATGAICAGTCRGVVWHLCGGVWQQMPASPGSNLLSVVAQTPDNVWVLGYALFSDGSKADLVEHWDGRKLTTEDTGLPPMTGTGSPNGELGQATPIWAADNDPVSGELWAVGWSDLPAIAPRVIHRS